MATYVLWCQCMKRACAIKSWVMNAWLMFHEEIEAVCIMYYQVINYHCFLRHPFSKRASKTLVKLERDRGDNWSHCDRLLTRNRSLSHIVTFWPRSGRWAGTMLSAVTKNLHPKFQMFLMFDLAYEYLIILIFYKSIFGVFEKLIIIIHLSISL